MGLESRMDAALLRLSGKIGLLDMTKAELVEFAAQTKQSLDQSEEQSRLQQDQIELRDQRIENLQLSLELEKDEKSQRTRVAPPSSNGHRSSSASKKSNW